MNKVNQSSEKCLFTVFIVSRNHFEHSLSRKKRLCVDRNILNGFLHTKYTLQMIRNANYRVIFDKCSRSGAMEVLHYAFPIVVDQTEMCDYSRNSYFWCWFSSTMTHDFSLWISHDIQGDSRKLVNRHFRERFVQIIQLRIISYSFF